MGRQSASAILRLRYDDLRLDVKPHGAIRWPAATDKKRKEWVVPISPSVRAALDRIMAARPGMGAAYLFPSFVDSSRPIGYESVRNWLVKAEERAGLAKQKNGAFHPYRRKWATERKHLPDVDVAAAGGWSDTFSLKHSYQQADDATMLEVVLGGGELRERQA